MSHYWPMFMPECGHFSQLMINDQRVCELCAKPPVMQCTHVPDKHLEDGTWLCEFCSRASDGWFRERANLIDPTKTWGMLEGRKMICFICLDERNFYMENEAPPGMEKMHSSWSAYGFRFTPDDAVDYWYCGCDGWE